MRCSKPNCSFLRIEAMTDFLLVALACTQIPIIFVFTSRTGLRLANYYCHRRNPDWVATHAEFNRHIVINTAARRVAWLIAAVSAIAIVKYVFITPSPAYYAWLLVAPLTVWVSGYLVYIAIFYLAVTRQIPAPSRRQASLADRRFSSFAPRWTAHFCYTLLLLILMIYTWAWLSEALASALAARRLLAFAGAIILGSGVLLVTLRRKNSEMEYILGASGRMIEVIAAMTVLYLIALVGGLLILHDFFNTALFSHASLLIAVSLLAQIYFLAYCLHPRVRASLRNSFNTVRSTSRRSTHK